MKILVHVPTEQYGFVSAEIEIEGKPPVGAIKEFYDNVANEFTPKPINSLPTKEWNKFIERVLQGEPNHIDELEQCSPEQKRVTNEIKKALARLEAKGGREARDRFNEN